ncbi:MAG: TonB-dependent receptor [Acidobacteriota bacterium]
MAVRVRTVLIVSLLASWGLAAPPSAGAQQGTAEVRGRVTDAQGGVLPGVTVVVRNQDTGLFRETVSNTDGTYFASGIVPGVYEITAELTGFKRYSRRDVRLEIGKTTSVDVLLEVGGVEEVVSVVGTTPLVDLTSKEVGGSVTARELVELPSVNRNFVGFLGLLPGIIPTISTESFGSDSVTVNGQDPRNNNYLLDGANNNDDVIGQRAGTQARTPIEAVQEFQVITNQFDAEFGRTTGAVVNAVTKQGTNVFRGSAFGFFQDASLNARDFFAKLNNLDKPDTSQQQFGGTLGGPVVRDKAHFFFSLERVRIDEGITINLPARPELNTTTTEKTRVWNTVVRFDHQINPSHIWGVRWLREDSPQFNQIIGNVTLAAAREEADVDQTVVGTLNSVLGNTRVNTLRLAWTREDVAFANPCFNGNGQNQAACPPTLAFQTLTDQQSNVAQGRVNDAYQIENTLSWFVPDRRGDHDVRVGFQWQHSQSRNDNQGNMNGTFSFSQNNGPFDPANPRTFPDRFSIRVPGASRSFNRSQSIALFAQDKWKMNDRLTVTLGLRYDLESVRLPEVDNPLFESPDDWPVDTNNIQPRIGVAYDLGGGRTVLRGGYGRFFDKTHFELVGGVLTNTPFTDSFVRNFPLNNIDPGPLQGQRPTDPFLAGGPVVTDAMRAALAALFPPGTTVRNTGATFDNPDRVIPYTDQLSVGIERHLAEDVSVSADYVHAFARDLLIARAINPTLRATTAVTSPNVRQGSALLSRITAGLQERHPGFAPFTGNVTTFENAGETDYDALMLQAEKRFSRGYSVRASYTLSHSRGNTSGAGIPTSPFQVLDDLNLDRNEGPTDFDRRHNLVVSGMVLVPRTRGLTLSWVARAMSGTPFTLFNSLTDPDRNGDVTDPLAAGTFSGTGPNAITVDNTERRNGARGPGFAKVDVRFGYRFALGQRRQIDVFGEIFNLMDRDNFANPNGNQAAATFLQLTSLSTSTTPRTGQVGIRFAF